MLRNFICNKSFCGIFSCIQKRIIGTTLINHGDCNDGDKTDLKDLFHPVAQRIPYSRNKITVVGAGAVGLACVVPLLCQHIASEIALIDIDENKLKGEIIDLQHAMHFVEDAKIDGGVDYSITQCSRVCVITAGVRVQTGGTRLDIIKPNAELFKKLIPELAKYSPDAVFVIATNPCDVLSHFTAKVSGLPKHRIIGSGTIIDTARFKYALAQKFNISPSSCQGYVIGEHGDSSVIAWSGVTVGGMRLRDIYPQAGLPDDPDKLHEIHDYVIKSGSVIREFKGNTSWGIGFSVAHICKNILRNSHKVIPVTVPVQGLYGIEGDVYLSLPTILGQDGICEIVKLQLDDEEVCGLQRSAEILQDAQRQLDT